MPLPTAVVPHRPARAPRPSLRRVREELKEATLAVRGGRLCVGVPLGSLQPFDARPPLFVGGNVGARAHVHRAKQRREQGAVHDLRRALLRACPAAEAAAAHAALAEEVADTKWGIKSGFSSSGDPSGEKLARWLDDLPVPPEAPPQLQPELLTVSGRAEGQ